MLLITHAAMNPRAHLAAFSRHSPSAHPLAQCQDREGGQWLTVETLDMLPTAGHSQGRGGS